MKRFSQRPTLEILEDRQLLSTCHVVRLGDFGAGADLGGGQSRGDLRYCINKANDEPGADSILLERAGTINLTGPLPNLSDDVLIAGPGSDQVTIRRDTGGEYRIFTVDANVTAQLFGMTLTNGLASGSGDMGNGGGILNFGTLILLGDIAVVQNRAQNGGGGIYTYGDITAYFSSIESNLVEGAICSNQQNGGGIYIQSGTLMIYHSTVAANDACGRGGGMYNAGDLTLEDVQVSSNTSSGGYGGGIYNIGVLEITDSRISDNATTGIPNTNTYGGGIYNTGAATIRYSTISDNSVDATIEHLGGNHSASGGGVSSIGTLVLENSAVVGNRATAEAAPFFNINPSAFGGGVHIHTNGTATISDSTVAENSGVASGGDISDVYGGGISVNSGSSVSVSHSTIAFNHANSEYGSVDGLNVSNGAIISLQNSIIANNEEDDLSGSLTTSGYNLIGDSAGGSGYAPTDILNVDPLLGPLQDNGGPTETMALLPGSPAIDAGDPNPVEPPEWDQRGPGFPRIVNGRIDIGAFEVQATGAPSFDGLAVLITADLGEDEGMRG